MFNSVGLPFSPERIKAGYETSLRYDSDKSLSLSILRGQSNVIQLASEYQRSYSQASVKTVLHYRDACIVEAFNVCLRQTQLKNPDSLTSHSKKVWNHYSFDDIWPYRSPEEKIQPLRYWGPLGTLAYYFQYSQPSSAVTLLRTMLSNYWATLGIESLTPSKKFTKFLQYISPDTGLFSTAQDYLKTLFSNLDDSNLSVMIKRSALTLSDCLDLKSRILSGEYSPYLPLILSEILPSSMFLQVQDVIANVLSVSKPSGLALVSQALVLEGYLGIIEGLMNVPESHLLSPLVIWKRESSQKSVHQSLALHYYLISQAYAVQAYWNMMDDSSKKSQEAASQYKDWLFISGIETLDLSEYQLGEHFV
jgi:hypothetical protein